MLSNLTFIALAMLSRSYAKHYQSVNETIPGGLNYKTRKDDEKISFLLPSFKRTVLNDLSVENE